MDLSSRPALLAFALLALAGCPDDREPPAPPPVVAFSVTPASLELQRDFEETSPAPVVIHLAAAEPVRASVEFNVDLVLVDAPAPAAEQDLTLQPAVPSARGAGVHEGTLRLHVYASRDGRWVDVKDSPVTLPYSCVVTKPVLTVTPSELRLSAVAGEALEGTLALDGRPGEGDWFVEVVSPDGPVAVEPSSGSALPATVHVRVNTAAAVSDYLNVVVRRAGREERVYTWVYVAVAPITYAGPPVQATWLLGAPGSPPPIIVPLGTTTGASTYFLGSLRQTSENWPPLYLGPDANGTAPGEFSFTVVEPIPPPGSYTGVLSLIPIPGPDPGLGITFTFHVSAGSLSFPLDPIELRADPFSAAADAKRTVELAASAPGLAVTVTSDAPWLAVSPGAGVPSPTLTITAQLVAEALTPSTDGYLTGRIAVSWEEPDGTPVLRRIPVHALTWFPGAGRVEPPAVASGPLTVEVPDGHPPCEPPAIVMFGDARATASTCVRPGLLRVTPPPLSPGTYPVWISNALDVRRESGAALTVLAPAPREAAAWPSPGSASHVFLDERTGSLFSVHPGAGQIVRRREHDGWAADVLELAGLQDAVLRGGGDRLVAISSAGVHLVDPGSLSSIIAEWPEGAAAGGWIWRLTPGAFGDVYAFSDGYGSAGTMPLLISASQGLSLPGNPFVLGGRGASSGDLGATVGVRHGDPNLLRIWAVHVDGGYFEGLAFASGTQLSLDRTGGRVLLLDEGPTGISSRLLTGAFADVPGVLPSTTATAVLSADGTRAYTFDAASRAVRTFDLAGPPEAGAFVELSAPITPHADPGGGLAMALSADERTVLLAGDAHVVLVPLP